MLQHRPEVLRTLPFIGLLLIWNVVCWRFPFFWDNILNSRIAQWYLSSGFSALVVPEEMDAGHPPFFSLYIALAWKVFGSSLAVAHLAMLPFLLGIQWLSYRMGKRFLPGNLGHWAMLIPFIEPAILAQSAQISPDVALLFFYLLAMEALLVKRRGLLFLALIGMAAVSFRGILSFSAIFCTDLALGWLDGKRRPDWIKVWPYLGAGLAAMAWLWYHQHTAGWLLTPPESTYGGHRKLAGIQGGIRNLAIIVWRLFDNGRVLMWAWLAFGLWRVRAVHGLHADHKRLFMLCFFPILLLSILFIPFTNPIGHRYFLVAYFFGCLLSLRLVLDVLKGSRRILMLAVLVLALVTGHFWVYPDAIAKGWDASLAHLPYHGLKEKALGEMEKLGIGRHEVCTDFPMLSAESSIDPGKKGAESFLPLPLSEVECKYILYSNISNGFREAPWKDLEGNGRWRVVFRHGRWPVRMVLYQQVAEFE